MDADIVMETGGFAKFADFFFDGMNFLTQPKVDDEARRGWQSII